MKPQLEPTIATRRLALRLPRMDDVDDLVAGLDDPAVARMLARVPLPYRAGDAAAFLEIVRRGARTGTALNLAIVHDGRLVGGIGIADMPLRCEFGYWLARPYWGRGFATEAGAAILAYGFDVLGLRLIRSAVAAENRASLRVQQKLGFAAIGRGMRHSLARGADVPHIDTVLTRARYQAFAG